MDDGFTVYPRIGPPASPLSSPFDDIRHPLYGVAHATTTASPTSPETPAAAGEWMPIPQTVPRGACPDGLEVLYMLDHFQFYRCSENQESKDSRASYLIKSSSDQIVYECTDTSRTATESTPTNDISVVGHSGVVAFRLTGLVKVAPVLSGRQQLEFVVVGASGTLAVIKRRFKRIKTKFVVWNTRQEIILRVESAAPWSSGENGVKYEITTSDRQTSLGYVKKSPRVMDNESPESSSMLELRMDKYLDVKAKSALLGICLIILYWKP